MVKFETVLLMGSSVLSEKLFFGHTDQTNKQQHEQQQKHEIELCGDFTGTEGSIQTHHPHKK